MGERVGRISVIVMFECDRDLSTYRNSLLRITKEIAEHADILRVWQLDQHNDIWPVVLERWMHRVPYAFPGIDAAFPGHFFPGQIK